MQATELIMYLILFMAAGFVFGVLMHEVGHLIGGLITGYRLVYFGLFGVTLCRRANGTELKFYRGMPMGQCVMKPKDPEIDARLIILGGILMNVVCTVAAGIVGATGFFLRGLNMSSYIWSVFAAANFITLAGNLTSSDPASDINTFKEIKRDRANMVLYNRIMCINELAVRGVSFAQMPENLFLTDTFSDTALKAELMLYGYYRLLEECSDVKEAEKELNRIEGCTLKGIEEDIAYEKEFLKLIRGGQKGDKKLQTTPSRMRMGEDVLKMKRSRNLGFDREYYKKRIAAELYPGEWETAMNTVTRLGRYAVKNANVKEINYEGI